MYCVHGHSEKTVGLFECLEAVPPRVGLGMGGKLLCMAAPWAQFETRLGVFE